MSNKNAARAKKISTESKVRHGFSLNVNNFELSLSNTYTSIYNDSGNDALKFLQGLVTNDVNELTSSQYAAFLNNKGRVVSDAILSMVSKDDYLIDCHSDQSKILTRQLKMYKLRSDVNVEDLSETHDVLWSKDNIDVSAISVYEDPRVPELGTRFVVPTSEHDDVEDAEDYEDLRFRLGVAEGPEMSNSVPLEFNLDRLNGVSFRKGCYVGQELTARTHFRGVVRKRCMPCTIRNESQERSEDSPRVIKDSQTNKKVGKLISIRNNSKDETSLGLAMIRQEYFENRTTDSKWVLEDSAVEIVPTLPEWWVVDE